MMTLTIEEFGRALRAGETSSVEVTESCLRRIDTDNPRLNAFILVMADQARRGAEEADRDLAAGRDHGPLHGVPVSVKDLFDINGVATTAASRVREGHVARSDARAIVLLRRAGAIFIGKTNLHEFAFGTTNEDSAFGPAHNPYDIRRSPGGSSGGSAASVAAGMALATLGTDTGGSIRIPAAACGIVGLKPTYGETPTEGVVPLSKTLDHVGPLTRTVTDAWHVYHALVGRPPSHPLSPASVAGLRLAVPRTYFCDVLDDDVRARFDGALDRLREAGAQVHDVVIAHAALTAPVYLHICFGDAARYHAATLDTMPERYTPEVRRRLEAARYALAEDYVRALDGRDALGREVDRALSGYDALALPTLPIPAPEIGASSVEIGSTKQPIRALMLRLTQLFNLTGHPAVSLPCGLTSGGLPCGLQLVGARAQTDTLLRVALAIEQTLQRLHGTSRLEPAGG
jgi:aspartyl-tRNA(Asn)/glutamyl-tRNA(Gln) amidotransferase subunit A